MIQSDKHNAQLHTAINSIYNKREPRRQSLNAYCILSDANTYDSPENKPPSLLQRDWGGVSKTLYMKISEELQ